MASNPSNRTLEELAENPYLAMIPRAKKCEYLDGFAVNRRLMNSLGSNGGLGRITGYQPSTPNTAFIHTPLPMSDLQSFASIHRPNPDNSYFMTTGLEQKGSSFQVKDNWGYVPSYKEQQRDNSIQLDLLQRWADPDYRPKFKMY